MTVLTVSTLGAPAEPLETVLAWLAHASVSAIELRLSAGQIIHPGMTRPEAADVKRRLDEAGVSVTGLASYIRVASDANDEMVLGALSSALALAKELGAPIVRVFPGAPTHPGPNDQRPELLESIDEVDSRASRRLTAVAHLSEDLGVHAALETHDSHPRGEDVARILAQVEGPVGAVWDLMHPWRVGEPLELTWRVLSPWILNGGGSVQVKDADLSASSTPLLIGDGTLPVDEFADLLIASDFDGAVCLEWEKAWYPNVSTLDVALASACRWFTRKWPQP